MQIIPSIGQVKRALFSYNFSRAFNKVTTTVGKFWVLTFQLFSCRHWMNYRLMQMQLKGAIAWMLTQQACQRFTVYHPRLFIQQVVVQRNPTQLLPRTQGLVNHLILENYIHHTSLQIQMEVDAIRFLACIQQSRFEPFKGAIDHPSKGSYYFIC